MIKTQQIPAEVVKAIENMCGHDVAPAEIIAAALNAWPGMMERHWPNDPRCLDPELILPLQQEKTDG